MSVLSEGGRRGRGKPAADYCTVVLSGRRWHAVVKETDWERKRRNRLEFLSG